MDQITNNDVLDFIRMIVDFGNVYHLDDSDMTIIRSNGEKCCDIDDDGATKPIQIAFPQRAIEDSYCLFNPLKMTIADSQASDKKGKMSTFARFYSEREMTLSVLIKKLILKIVEVGYTKEVDSYEGLDVLSSISENCDKTMVEELNKINPADYFSVFYMNKTKTAEAQTSVFTEYLENKHKNFRKKTWETLKTLYTTLFDLKAESMSQYSYRAKVLSLPNVDAKLHVMGMIIKVINPLCKTLLKTDLMPEQWEKHLNQLDTYVHMWAWLTAKASVSDKNISIISNGQDTPAPAWGTTPSVAPVAAPPEMSNHIPINANPSVSYGMPVAQPQMPTAMPQMPVMNTGMCMMPTAAPAMGMPAAMPMQVAMPMAQTQMPMAMGQMPVAMQSMPTAYPTYTAPEDNRIPIC